MSNSSNTVIKMVIQISPSLLCVRFIEFGMLNQSFKSNLSMKLMGLGIAWHDLVKFQNFHPWQFKSVTTPCLLTDDVLFRLEHENNISLQSELFSLLIL